MALHNVGHFLKKNPILSLYLSIPPYYEQNVIGTNLRPTLEHCILFCVSHVHLWLEWFGLLGPYGRLDLSKFSFVNELVPFAPLPVEQFAGNKSLLLH